MIIRIDDIKILVTLYYSGSDLFNSFFENKIIVKFNRICLIKPIHPFLYVIVIIQIKFNILLFFIIIRYYYRINFKWVLLNHLFGYTKLLFLFVDFIGYNFRGVLIFFNFINWTFLKVQKVMFLSRIFFYNFNDDNVVINRINQNNCFACT